MTYPRRLIVMRHAKAEPFASNDHGRRLTDRGVADATEAGAHLATQGYVPDHAVVSSAARTVATWEAVAASSGASAVVEIADTVYNASPHVVLDALRGVPVEAGTVILVGHSPTAPYLAHYLDDGEGEPDAVTAMLRGFPTAALAVFGLEAAWTELDEGAGRLLTYHVGGSATPL